MKVKVTIRPRYGTPVTEILNAEDIPLMFPIFADEIRNGLASNEPIHLTAEMNDIKVDIEPYDKEKEDDTERRRKTRSSCESVKSFVKRVKRNIRRKLD